MKPSEIIKRLGFKSLKEYSKLLNVHEQTVIKWDEHKIRDMAEVARERMI